MAIWGTMGCIVLHNGVHGKFMENTLQKSISPKTQGLPLATCYQSWSSLKRYVFHSKGLEIGQCVLEASVRHAKLHYRNQNVQIQRFVASQVNHEERQTVRDVSRRCAQPTTVWPVALLCNVAHVL